MRFCFSLAGAELRRISALSASDNPMLIIARGIASGPLWSRMPEARLGVRLSPPEIVVEGSFSPDDIARLKALVWQVKHALATLRYVGYFDLEQDCRVLAARLDETIGRKELKRWYFTGIPRGGLLVLGVLAYILGLERWQLELPPSLDAPVVVVDDCSLTGKRLREFLEKKPGGPVIFAPLYATPDLRSAVMAGTERVKACISARDLEICPYPGPDDRKAADAVSESCEDLRRCLTEYVCFAWNEPDFMFWNPVTKKMEGTWTVLPTDLCLKNGPVRIPVKILPDIRREFRIADDIIILREADQVTIDNLVTHDRYRLTGIAAELWDAFIETGTPRTRYSNLTDEYDVDPAFLESDISGFFQDLQSQGILAAPNGR